MMKHKLYLNDLKNQYNDDENSKMYFDESQTGPQEEPSLLSFDLDVSKFKDYLHDLDTKRQK